MKRSHANTGFWLVLGLAAGMLVSDLTDEKTASAGANATNYNDFCMAVGRTAGGQIDMLWLLDYSGARLHCITLDQQGRLGSAGQIDLLEEFELDEETKPHFMMVTGTYATQNTDVLYLAETSSGVLLSIAPPSLLGRGIPPKIFGKLRFKDVVLE